MYLESLTGEQKNQAINRQLPGVQWQLNDSPERTFTVRPPSHFQITGIEELNQDKEQQLNKNPSPSISSNQVQSSRRQMALDFTSADEGFIKSH